MQRRHLGGGDGHGEGGSSGEHSRRGGGSGSGAARAPHYAQAGPGATAPAPGAALTHGGASLILDGVADRVAALLDSNVISPPHATALLAARSTVRRGVLREGLGPMVLAVQHLGEVLGVLEGMGRWANEEGIEVSAGAVHSVLEDAGYDCGG